MALKVQNFRPLFLSVKAANWRMNDEHSEYADAEFKHVRLQALERDDRTCQFCGFRAPKWQEVHHLNDDHSDNRPENLATACSFCHMCQHIGLAGRNEEAILVWLPEIEQYQLNHIVRSMLVVRRWADGVSAERKTRPSMRKAVAAQADAVGSLEASLRARAAMAEELIGTSRPLELANIMLNMPDSLYEKRTEFLDGIRLLPTGHRKQGGEDIMPKMVDSWLTTGGPYANLNPRTWITIVRQHLPEIAEAT